MKKARFVRGSLLLAMGILFSAASHAAAQQPEVAERATAAQTIVRWAVAEKSPEGFGPTDRAQVLARKELVEGSSRSAVQQLDKVDLVSPPASCLSAVSYCDGSGQWAFQLDRLEITPSGASFTISQVIWNESGRVSEVIKYSGVLQRRGAEGWMPPVDVSERFMLFGG